MKLIKYALIAFIYISSANLLAKGTLVNIAYPLDNSLHRETTLNVVVDVLPRSIDQIVIVTALGEKNIDTKSAKFTYCKSVALKLGENTISVRAYKNKKMINEQIARVYVASEIYHEYKYPPKIYKQTFFHADDKEAKCVKCHDMSVNEKEGIAFINIKESNCYQCHNKLTTEKFGHAPAVNWLCTSCHNGKTASHNDKHKGKSKYIAAKPVNETCFKCHKDNFKRWNSYRYRHEPLDSGNCNKCHNPHASPYSMFVRKPSNQICLGCHKDKRGKAKKAAESACNGTYQGKKCVECHSPHASSRKFLLKEPGDISDIKKKKLERERKKRERKKERERRKLEKAAR